MIVLTAVTSDPGYSAEPVTSAGSITLVSFEGATLAFVGVKPSAPAPTLFVFAADRTTSLSNPVFIRAGQLLSERYGFLCVSLDMPGHGGDARAGQAEGLHGWCARVAKGENFVGPFVEQASKTLNYLIREGFTDPRRVAVLGISRGGFMAFHFMAADARVAVVAALSPVTDLPVLTEFKGLETNRLTQSLAVKTLAARLANRPIWISIGNRDTRVGTDNCISFARAVADAAAPAHTHAPIVLHVLPSENHHQTKNAHEEAADWIANQLNSAPTTASRRP